MIELDPGARGRYSFRIWNGYGVVSPWDEVRRYHNVDHIVGIPFYTKMMGQNGEMAKCCSSLLKFVFSLLILSWLSTHWSMMLPKLYHIHVKRGMGWGGWAGEDESGKTQEHLKKWEEHKEVTTKKPNRKPRTERGKFFDLCFSPNIKYFVKITTSGHIWCYRFWLQLSVSFCLFSKRYPQHHSLDPTLESSQ